MKTGRKIVSGYLFRALSPALIFFFYSAAAVAQEQIPFINKQGTGNTVVNKFATHFIAGKQADLFGTNTAYIQNIGQYGDTLENYGQMGKIQFAYEGMGMPVLFTDKGVIHLQRRSSPPTYRGKRKMERSGMKEEDIEKTEITINRVITFEWVNANPHPQIIAEDLLPAYHVYGFIKEKARAYKKITYREIYPGIDAEYSFISAESPGFEFRLLVKPGAAIDAVKMRYGGDIKSIKTDADGRLLVQSDIEGVIQAMPLCFFPDSEDKNEKKAVAYVIKKNTVSFDLPAGYSGERAFIIDPFVSGTATLAGVNANKAKEIDFDYDGNIYVVGGGDGARQRLAKFDPSGVLLWTFNGSLTTPVWNFGGSYGGWVVEKTTENIYLGQGLAGSGFSVIRLNASGSYDNYITTPNSSFGENWKMLWSCNGGQPRMLIAGGGGSANNELALLSPPSVVPTTSNLSGLSGGHNDISDIVIDEVTNEMYSIYSKSVNVGGLDNVIFKHPPPYTSAIITWQVPSGFNSLREPNNRPYLTGLDNSSNTLAVNSHYLFYYDGVNLKAFNKATGAAVGTPIIVTGGSLLQQGGIFADECDNVFVGSHSGIIKVYQFTGSVFNDGGAGDIGIAGFSSASIYDLAYDNARRYLYACGNGFVASIDISFYCPSTAYTVSVVSDCTNLSATVTVSPAPPPGTTVSYVLYNGTTEIMTNNNGVFTGLTSGINYTVKAFLNRACGGTQAFTVFSVTNSSLVITNPAPICMPGTVDLTDPAITSGSAPGLGFTYWTNAAATIPLVTPSAISVGGTYYIKATSASGCPAISPVVVNTFPSPVANAGTDQRVCFGNSTQLQGSGGATYSWSPSTYLDNPNISNPRVINPPDGIFTYHLAITDANGCRSLADDDIRIIVSRLAKVFAGNDTAIAFNQPLQLNAVDVNSSGFNQYLWSPSYGLNDPLIQNPVANLDRDIVYRIKASSPGGCEGIAYIRIKVYKGPEIYVPTAFTPDNDGLNDVVRPIVVGLKEFHYFSIFNRWGQQVFTTRDPQNGWDGKIDGLPQASGVFVWMTEGVDYKGNLIQRKGTTTIIR